MTTKATKPTRSLKLVGMLSGLYLLGLNGCAGAQEFRAVAGDSLQTGLTTIATGVIDGLFAVFEPDTTTE
jgi:hypothetical protein